MLIPVQGLEADSSFVIQEFKMQNVNVFKKKKQNRLQTQHLILSVADSPDAGKD